MTKTNLETAQDGNNPVKNYIKRLEAEVEQARESALRSRLIANIEYEDFETIFKLHSKKILVSKKQAGEFVIDNNNRQALKQLYYYLVGDLKNFKGNIYKGIMIVGKIGVGKTMIMNVFLNICEHTILKKKSIKRAHSKEVAQMVLTDEKNNTKFSYAQPLFIDDIGKENKTFNDFGTVINPVSDLFSARYDYGSLTFATANYSKDSFTKFYGDTISDRFVEMFNIIRLDGEESRRK